MRDIDLTIDKKSYQKFIVFSLLGVLLFLMPIPNGGSFTVLTAMLSDFIIASTGNLIVWFTMVLLVVCAILQPVASIAKPKWIVENRVLSSLFVTTPLYYISSIVAAVFIVMCYFHVGPEPIISDATGQTILGIANPLVGIILAITYFMPFLTEFGLMEYVGVFLRKITRPLFKLPGKSAINIVTSWLGAANMAVVLTRSLYNKGQYTKRESAVIITAFSAVNVPFCLVVAETLDITQYFLQCYLVVCLVGIILAIITPRIPPLTRIPNEYAPGVEPKAMELVPEGVKARLWARKIASEQAGRFELRTIFKSGTEMLFGILIGTLPVVFAWGTITLILVEYTPILGWISYPFGLLFDVLGVEEAFAAAPAALAGFADMFIPAVLGINIESVVTRWIIGTLSLVQIIFMTEVGILAIQSKVGLNVANLFIIFLERTIIAIPLIVLAANIVF